MEEPTNDWHIKASALHLLAVVHFVDGNKNSFDNQGNGRQNALRYKIDSMKALIEAKNTYRIARAIDVALIGIKYSTCHDHGRQLWKSNNVEHLSNWQATNCSADMVRAAFSRLGIVIDQGNNPENFSLATYVLKVQNWWEEFTGKSADEQKQWIRERNWSAVDDLWLGSIGNGMKSYSSVEDILDCEGNLFLQFVLVNFVRLSRIAIIVS